MPRAEVKLNREHPGTWWTILYEIESHSSKRFVAARCRGCGKTKQVQFSNIRELRSTKCTSCARRLDGTRRRKANYDPAKWVCRWCGKDYSLSFEKNHRRAVSFCAACRQRVFRNGRCKTCEFPLYKSKGHDCKRYLREEQEQPRPAPEGQAPQRQEGAARQPAQAGSP
jgi:ribosomal protein S27E